MRFKFLKVVYVHGSSCPVFPFMTVSGRRIRSSLATVVKGRLDPTLICWNMTKIHIIKGTEKDYCQNNSNVGIFFQNSPPPLKEMQSYIHGHSK